MLALQLGLPGTQELVIIVLILVLLAVPALIVAGIVLLLLRWRSGDDETEERVAELEAEVERLRDQQGASQNEESDTADDDRTSTDG